ncbi:MAG: hypothetical protein OEZ34_10660, partial [Spirochaetia bacterium]|nr:hypothetical protein [Spirochaetia bacterium]
DPPREFPVQIMAGAANLKWCTYQIHRMAEGKDPDPKKGIFWNTIGEFLSVRGKAKRQKRILEKAGYRK